jgi:hypothetical protein
MFFLSFAANFTCPHNYIKCPSSYCIPFHYVCNGNADCPDGYDEKLCGKFTEYGE